MTICADSSPNSGKPACSAKSDTAMKKKKPYVKPSIRTEKVFETAALACGKCNAGPTGQLACRTLKKVS